MRGATKNVSFSGGRRRTIHRSGAFLGMLLAGLVSPADADFYFNGPRNEDWLIVSPQIGRTLGTSGGWMGGCNVSWYATAVGVGGVGAGLLASEDQVQAEILAKVALMGVAGGSAGIVLDGGAAGFTGDLWGSALLAGVRWRYTRIREESRYGVLVFLPLWYLNLE